jgi:hypothetical protein
VPPSSARRLADRIRGSQLIEIDRANHLLLRRYAPRLAETILS